MTASILLIDAERTAVARTMPVLVREGYDVAHVPPGPAALDSLSAMHPDLVILSLDPHAGGTGDWHFCRQIVASLTSPLLLLLPDHDESARVKGLQLGADDCMTCPVQLLELVARVRALLRRSRRHTACSPQQAYVDGDLTVDLSAARVSLDGTTVPLTPAEFHILACLVDHAGEAVPVQHLLAAAAHTGCLASPAAVRRCIRRLRHKLETDPRRPCRLVTRRGQGYALVKAATPAT